MNKVNRFLRATPLFWACVALMVILLSVLPLIKLGVNKDIIWVFSNGGTLLVILVLSAYVIFFDSKKRWPGTPILHRIGRIFDF